MQLRHRMLLIALLAFDFGGKVFKVSTRSLRNTSGLGFDAIRVATQELKDEGLIKVSSKPHCLTEYDLTPFYDRYIESQKRPEPVPLPDAPRPSSSAELPADVLAALEREGLDKWGRPKVSDAIVA